MEIFLEIIQNEVVFKLFQIVANSIIYTISKLPQNPKALSVAITGCD